MGIEASGSSQDFFVHVRVRVVWIQDFVSIASTRTRKWASVTKIVEESLRGGEKGQFSGINSHCEQLRSGDEAIRRLGAPTTTDCFVGLLPPRNDEIAERLFSNHQLTGCAFAAA